MHTLAFFRNKIRAAGITGTKKPHVSAGGDAEMCGVAGVPSIQTMSIGGKLLNVYRADLEFGNLGRGVECLRVGQYIGRILSEMNR